MHAVLFGVLAAALGSPSSTVSSLPFTCVAASLDHGVTLPSALLTCASRLCLRSLTRPSKLLDVELCWTQLRQVPELLYKKCHGSSPAVVRHHKHCCSYICDCSYQA